MKTYTVLDSTLRSVSQGERVFPVVDGVVELPGDIAEELIASGQIKKFEKPAEDLGPEKPMTAAEKRAAAKAAKEAAAAKAAKEAAAAKESEESEGDE